MRACWVWEAHNPSQALSLPFIDPESCSLASVASIWSSAPWARTPDREEGREGSRTPQGSCPLQQEVRGKRHGAAQGFWERMHQNHRLSHTCEGLTLTCRVVKPAR